MIAKAVSAMSVKSVARNNFDFIVMVRGSPHPIASVQSLPSGRKLSGIGEPMSRSFLPGKS